MTRMSGLAASSDPNLAERTGVTIDSSDLDQRRDGVQAGEKPQRPPKRCPRSLMAQRLLTRNRWGLAGTFAVE